MPSRCCWRRSHLDLVGVTTVHGNNSLENTTRNALGVFELGGIEVPLARGCAEPLAMSNAGEFFLFRAISGVPLLASPRFRHLRT
jgi:inosine-uridine nucleoside N-ribohydrolase